MASQEHVQQFLDDDSSSTSTSDSSSSDNDSSTSDEPQQQQPPPSLSSVPPKMRIKLSLKLSKSQEEKNKEAKTDDTTMEIDQTDASTPTPTAMVVDEVEKSDKKQQEKADDDDEVVKATVVHSSDDAHDDVEAQPVVSAPTVAKKKTARPVRMPPMSSPGLLIPPSAGVYRGDADVNGFTTPASVFDHCMASGGYTVESRTNHPHRGSSVKREVGDMFDSNVTLALHFPPLVPKEVWNLKKKEEDEKLDGDVKEENPRDVAQLLLQELELQENGNTAKVSRKRRRPLEFEDMVPLSLTLPYPESYLQKRLEYVKKVKEREKAIVASQQAKQRAQVASERYNHLHASTKRGADQTPPPPESETVVIPPIPEPPTPPRLSELEHYDAANGLDESQHPIYVPSKKLTAHLDQNCFHVTEGRYFGLLSNGIADPHFVGPNAPGIAGLNFAGGTGLATSYAGSGSGGGSASSLSAAYYGSVGGGSTTSTSKSAAATKSSKKSATVAAAVEQSSAKPQEDGPTPTSNTLDLRRIMEEGGELAEEMRSCIIRAAVYASRTGKHGGSFTGANGETYPGVSKAFSTHAGLRPCSRCKNNKQGAYHCRLRRKHKDLDYNGGNSPEILAPLFQEPLEQLIRK